MIRALDTAYMLDQTRSKESNQALAVCHSAASFRRLYSP